MPTPPDAVAFLGKTALFAALPAPVLEALAGSLQVIALRKGETLFEAGAAGEAAFVVRSGLVHVVDTVGAGGRVLGEIGRGHHLGEMAVLTGEPRAAGAVAAMESVLYAIPGPLLRTLFADHPTLHARLSLGLMRTLQAQRDAAPRGVRTCALVGIGGAQVRSRALVTAVAEALTAATGQKIAVLDLMPAAPSTPGKLPDDLADMTRTLQRLVTPTTGASAGVTVIELGRDVPADAPIADLVAELRLRHGRVLIHALHPWEGAVPRAVAQCDALYFVQDAGDAAAEATCTRAAGEVAATVRQPPAPHAIVLDAGGRAGWGARAAAQGTQWTVPVEAGATAPFAAAPAARVIRALARALGGRRTALVLGAGGAKGFAHVGALQVFERAGIEFDAVAGTSIGAIVGAGIAMGWSASAIEQLLLGIAANPWRRLLDPRVPTEAFFSSRKKTELIKVYCADRRIEDLVLPFYALAGDLASLVPVVFERGPLALALDSTSAIPTIFRPVRHEHQLLVDGWVCNPLPADVAHARGFDRVVAIDLSPRSDGTARPAPIAPPRGGLGGRFRILAIAMRAMELASQEHVARTVPLADVLVRPDLDGFSSADLEGGLQMRDRGIQAAEAALPAIAEMHDDPDD